jgi:hypothetical protein
MLGVLTVFSNAAAVLTALTPLHAATAEVASATPVSSAPANDNEFGAAVTKHVVNAVDFAHVQSLQNEHAGIDFDLKTGTYSLSMPPRTGSVIRNARATVEGWASTDAGYQRRIVEQTKERLLIECARADAPTLLIEFTLHPSFVELRAGLKNTTGQPVRIKKYWPLAGGAAFPGEPWTDVRTLDAPSGANQLSVTGSAVRSSANNLLLTFKHAGKRRSLVLGALKTSDFTKWAHTLPAGIPQNLELPGLRVVSYLDCGCAEPGKSPIHVVRGKPYAFPGTTGPVGTVLFDEKGVELQVDTLDPQKRYALGFSWCDLDANGRVESVIVTGADQSPRTLMAKHALPPKAATHALTLPVESYADGKLRIAFTNDAKVPNAVVSEVWLWEMSADAKLPANMPDQQSPVTSVTAMLEGNDPIGKLVEPGETYLPEDSFYVDGATANPFEALEKYGRALREATGAKPNVYDFPTVCAWYAGVWRTGGAQDHPDKSTYKINTSSGLVEEAQKIKACGFLNYSRAAVRLVPDSYTEDNPQGWWDDTHWQKHGYYTAPYETSEKLGQGMHDAGCLAFTYIQPQIQVGRRISRDFREAHPDWLLNKEIGRNLDYSLPPVQDFVRSRFNALRGHIDGLMVDYCDELWTCNACGGGFADPHMTSTAFYRQFHRCVKDGLGPNSWIHERSINHPNNDLALGIVDSQRTETDTDKITPDLVSRSGLRWYKNRVVIAYDMDSKELTSAWKVGGWTGTDQDGRRMLLTMAYVAASRLLLANSFRDLKTEVLYDLERTFPYPTEPRSARPIDAFTHTGWPRVYDFAVTPDWHQVTLFNNTLPTRTETISVPLAGDTADGALGLDSRSDYYVYDFWNDRLVGKLKGTDTLQQTLRPGEARMLSIHKVERHPQFLSTNRHLMQGHLDLADVKWIGHSLTGKALVVAGEPFKIVIALNGYRPENLPVTDDGQFAVLTLERPQNETVEWGVTFK